MVKQGDRAVILYLVQRTDCDRVGIAADIDPTYASAVRAALATGVDVLTLDCRIDPTGVQPGKILPFTAP